VARSYRFRNPDCLFDKQGSVFFGVGAYPTVIEEWHRHHEVPEDPAIHVNKWQDSLDGPVVILPDEVKSLVTETFSDHVRPPVIVV
jgi:hypothetical protein